MTSPKHSDAETRVLTRIRPRPLPDEVHEALGKVEDALRQADIQAAVLMGGSSAKGTYLAGDHDIDVFVRFDLEYETERISDLLEPILASLFTIERIHGSRDYFHARVGDFDFEFIPVLHIANWEEALNVTDMSPLHVEYVRKHIDESPWLADEVRLLKQFCKAQKVYGAESYINGFSGYMVELLAIHYGNFHDVLRAVKDWVPKVIIDPEEQHEDALAGLDESKTEGPLVLVDPIQPTRNAAAALSQVTFDRFVMAASAYLEHDGEEMFTILPLDPKRFEADNAGARIIEVRSLPKQGSKDVVGTKCLKAHEHLVRELERTGFKVHESAWEFDGNEALSLFALDPGLLDEIEVMVGPPADIGAHADAFRAEHAEVYEENGRLYAREKRAFRDPLVFLEHLCSQGYVKERCASARAREI